jgi:hypothetical protein
VKGLQNHNQARWPFSSRGQDDLKQFGKKVKADE